MTQAERIMDYMREHGSINPKQAMEELGIMRLGARIFDLKEHGVPIVTERVIGKNRYGETTSFARYKLEEEKTC